MADGSIGARAAGVGAAASGIPPIIDIVRGPGGKYPEDFLDYFVGNRRLLLLESWLTALAAGLFLWFLGGLRAILRQAEGPTGKLSALAFGAGVTFAGTLFVQTAAHATVAYGAAASSSEGYLLAQPGLTASLLDFATILATLSGLPAAVFLAAVSVASIRTGALASWFGWLSGLLALASLARSLGLFVDSGTFAPGGSYGDGILVAFFLWVLVASLIMGRGPAAAPAEAA